jgi:hypothetical protein
MRIEALLITLLAFIASCHAAVCRFPDTFDGGHFSDWGIVAYSKKRCASQINRLEGTGSLGCVTLREQALSYHVFADKICVLIVYNGKGCHGTSKKVFRQRTAL